jgi:hypothetical protein
MNREIAELLYNHILLIKEKTSLPISISGSDMEYSIDLPSWSYLDDEDIVSIVSSFYDEYREKGINVAWGVNESVVTDNWGLVEPFIFEEHKAYIIA